MKLSQLAEKLGRSTQGDDPELSAALPLEEAGPGVLTFVVDEKYLPKLQGVGAVILPDKLADKVDLPCLISPAPALDLARAAKLFGAREMAFDGIDSSAAVDPSAKLGQGVAVGARAVIGPRVVIGDHTVIHPGAVIQERTIVGARCIIQSNAVIGSEGFGYEYVDGGHQRIPHFGIVRLEDDVHVGACTTIDRARFGETLIRQGTRIDNMVQVAHNVQVGRHVILVSQVGIAGSCEIGDGAVLGGQVGMVPHKKVGPGAQVGAATGIISDVPAGAVWSGYWGMEHRINQRALASLRRLPELMRQMRALLKKEKA
ncbi:MAG: UDP-3-O-(3-hydroxymyristoyl)glucosamine N-acyltransferase [Magnetococcales bacterium]|nr:UDP-3-O-(3-hydroxymyristoyl)glucosamine N-acyltransferase [Magnetococcales bacterium]